MLSRARQMLQKLKHGYLFFVMWENKYAALQMRSHIHCL
jgi:hypothetical protein